MKVKIKNIKRIESVSNRYDIQTGTSNFFANDILVHNSMIHLSFDWVLGNWVAGTSGTAEAEGEVNNKFGTTFSDLFFNTAPDDITDKLIKGYTYVFELCTPYNIVVKPHSTSSITLLTIRELSTLKELTYETVKTLAKYLRVDMVKSYDFNATKTEDLIKRFEGMPFTEEGYVVVDANFNRIKIKNPDYLAVHHLKSKTSEHAIMEIVKSNEIEEFGAVFPERKKEIVALKVAYDELQNKLDETWAIMKNHLPKNITQEETKKYAIKVFEVANERNLKAYTGLFFGLKDGKIDTVNTYLKDMDNKRLYNALEVEI